MNTSLKAIEKKIETLYKGFFKKYRINPKDGEFPKNSRWSFLKFPTYPLVGSKYSEDSNLRVLFIGLEIGKSESSGIMDFDTKRDGLKNRNPHVYGMGVATTFLLSKNFKLKKQISGKTYRNALELAEKSNPQFNPFLHFSMTNYAKFVSKKSRSRLASFDGKNISLDDEWNLLENEIKILNPKFLVFESGRFEKDHWLEPLIKEIVRQNKHTKIYISNHPSARGLHSNTHKYIQTFKNVAVKNNALSITPANII